MARQKKIKRYTKIYRSAGGPNRTPMKILLTTLGVVALAVLGWSLYEPVYNLIMGNISLEDPSSSISAPDPNVSASSPEGVSDPDGSNSQESSGSAQTPDVSNPEGVVAVYLPESVLLDQAQRTAMLDAAVSNGANGVYFDLKDASGVVTYQSKNETATQVEAISPRAIDLAAFVSECESRNLRVIGRLHCFKDPIAARGLPDAQVKYAGTEWAWLDNSQELGGKPWLNPFSQEAQTYLSDLAYEAVELGVDEIVLDSVHFPLGFSLEQASYGQTATPATQQQTLKSFVSQVTQRLNGRGASVKVYMPITAVLGSEQSRYGGNPVNLIDNGVLLGVMPSLFGNGFNSTDLVLESPVTTPYDTVSKALSAALPQIDSSVSKMVVVQNYTANNVDPLYNKTYTQEDLEAQQRAVQEQGISNMIIYSTQS